MNNDKQISICFLTEFPSLTEGIFVLVGVSKSQIKKYGLSKKLLNRSIKYKDEVSLPLNLVNTKKVNPLYTGEEIKTLYEDDNIYVLSKPHDVHCHPLSYCETDNLISYLYSLKRYDLLGVNSQEYDRGLLYRLDFSTSGLIVFLKKDSDYNYARENFKEVVTQKIYLAIVSGKYEGAQTLTHLLKSVGVKGAKVVLDHEHNADTKFARCDVELINYNEEKDMSLLKVSLDQGHRHQIRAQLRIEGYPIVGDKLYKGQKSSRLYLHCFQYEFRIGEKDYVLKDNELYGLFKLLSFNCEL